MPLPLITCPNCRATASLDLFLNDDTARDALHAVIDAHPAGETFIKPMLRYIGLFAPGKSKMAFSRIAALTAELTPAIRAAEITRNGHTWPAPQAYWQSAFQTVLDAAHAGKLTLPLKSHGYLLEVIARMSVSAAALAETTREAQRAGVSGVGTPRARAQSAVTMHAPASSMPPEVRQILQGMTKKLRAEQVSH